MINFGPVPAEYQELVWPRIEGYMDALDRRTRGAVTPDLIRRRVAAEHWMLWIAIDDSDDVLGFLLTEMSDDHRKTVCMINLAGRDLDLWEALGLQHVEAWARSQGSSHMIGLCRDGLVRRMARHGYTKTNNIIEKAL